MPEMPPIPDRMKRFPLWKNRYPIFYTVARNKDGTPNFRQVSRARQLEADRKGLCHVCGQVLWPPFWFICADMEVDHHSTKEGPMHEECARYAIAACPFLSNPHYVGHDPMRTENIAVVVYLTAHPEAYDGRVTRAKAGRLALCSSMTYRSDFSEQYPFWFPGEWVSVDWTAIPNATTEPT